MSEACLPPQWAEVTLGEIAEIQGGIQKGKKRSSSLPLRDVPYLRVANVQRGYLDLDVVQSIQATDDEISNLRLQVGDVLFNEGGDRDKLGRGWIWTGALSECIHQNHVFRARIIDRILYPKLLSWYGNTVGQQYFYDEGKQTTNLASLNSSKLKALPILVPPQAEQIRIVEAIESYLSRLDDAMATLERVQRNLKRYRASVLKAAVEGRLVPTEAELARMEGREYEPASALLERILAERRRRWEEAELAKMKAKGKAPKNDKWKAKYVEPAGPDTSELPELPEGWCWATVDSLAWEGDYGTSRKCHPDGDGPPVLRIPNVQNETLSFIDLKFTTGPDPLPSNGILAPGDFIFIRTNGSKRLIGRGALVVNLLPCDCHFASYLIRLRLASSQTTARWFALVWHAPVVRDQVLRDAASSAGQHNLSLSATRSYYVPIPPHAEQERILAEVERLASIADSSRSMVQPSIARVSRLRQSILKWAFEGRLADQDPNDEPAALLLERIRAERAASHGKKQPRTRRVNTRTASA
jgi:type I restriction enzyme, S subunit